MSRRRFRVSWRENVAFALVAMRTQKLRTFLTLLGVMAGVATVIMMVSFVVGFNNAVTAGFTSFGAHLVQFQKFEPRFGPNEPPEEQRNRRDLTIEDARALKRLSTLAAAVSPERYIFGTATVKAGKEEANGPLVVGVAPDYSMANTHFVQDGRFISDADVTHAAPVAVIGTDVAEALYPHRDPLDQELTLNGRAYRVVGLFERKGSFFGGSNDNFVAIPISAFDDQFPEIKNGGGDTIHIATVPRRPEDVPALIEEETAILRARRGLRPGQENDFALFTSAGMLENFQQITAGVAAAMIVIAGIALLVGGVGVMNIMLVNVTQRTREIGIRKALGATRRDVAIQFLVEAVTLTGVGGALGIGFGLGAAVLARVLFDFNAATPVWSVVLGFGVSSVVGVVFGLWPALKAARQDPIEALRYE
jgi:putative ABC transport system permease protein